MSCGLLTFPIGTQWVYVSWHGSKISIHLYGSLIGQLDWSRGVDPSHVAPIGLSFVWPIWSLSQRVRDLYLFCLLIWGHLAVGVILWLVCSFLFSGLWGAVRAENGEGTGWITDIIILWHTCARSPLSPGQMYWLWRRKMVQFARGVVRGSRIWWIGARFWTHWSDSLGNVCSGLNCVVWWSKWSWWAGETLLLGNGVISQQ